MQIDSFQELIRLKSIYDNTDYKIIKKSIIKLMDKHNKKPLNLINDLHLNKWTVYSYKNLHNTNKPELYTLLILSLYFNEDVETFFNSG